MSRFARKVTVLIRGAKPSWSAYLDVAIAADAKIEVCFHAELEQVEGDERVRNIVVKDNSIDALQPVAADAVFVFIGQKPQSDFAREVVQTADSGHILTGYDLVRNDSRPPGWDLERDPLPLETSVPGVFAAGDVRSGTRNGVAAATGEGNVAVSMFWQYLGLV